MYGITEQGQATLAAWMEVIEEVRGLLSAVLKRYDSILDAPSNADLEPDLDQH